MRLDLTTGSVLDAFAEVVRRHPDRPFLRSPTGALTLGEVDLLTNRIARSIAPSPERVPVAVLCRDSLEFQAAQLGALKSGRPAARVHPDQPVSRQELILEAIGPDTLIVSDGQALEGIDSGRKVIEMSDLVPDDSPPEIDVSLDDLGLLIQTSGSTGIPKVVAHSHRSLFARSAGMARVTGLSVEDRLLIISRMATLEMAAAFITGCALLTFDVREHGFAALPTWIRDERVTLFRSPPSVMRAVASEVGDTRFPALRMVVQAGEAFSPRDLEVFRSSFEPHTELLHFYGASETGVVTSQVVDRDLVPDSETVPAGIPAPGMTVTIEHADGTPVADGEPGLIVVGGPNLAMGYHRRDDLTAERFSGSGSGRRYSGGDLGRWDDEGRLVVLGRDDGQVKIGGNRVEVGEVEEALRHVEGVEEAVVVPRADTDGTTMLVGYYKHADPPPAVADLRRALALRLPGHMIPTRWVAVDAFSHATPAGKIDREALPDPPPAVHHEGSAVADRMADIWSDLLGVGEVAATDSFFGLGADSLAAAALVSAVEQEFDCRIEMADLFADDTFGAMCTIVGSARGKATDGLFFTLKRSGDLPPVYCIHTPGWQRIRYLALARAMGERQPMIGVVEGGVPEKPKRSTLAGVADRYAAAIREDSDGPYRLLGYSGAGVLAYEVARRLARSGEVDFIGMIDPGFPGAPLPIRSRIRKAVRRHGLWGVASIALARTAHRLGLRRSPPRRTSKKRLDRPDRQRAIHDLHRIVPFDAPVTYFRAVGARGRRHEVRAWRRLDARIVDVPGDHHTVLQEGNAAELAEAIDESIEGLAARSGQR